LIPRINAISCNFSSPKDHEFSDSTSSATLGNNALITLKNKHRGVKKLQIEVENRLRQKRKGKFSTIYFGYRLISIEIGVTCHGAFFKRLKFDIVFCETSNGTKGIVFHKGGNINFRVMK